MKKQLFFLLVAVSFFSGYSQIGFEEGYFIDNNGEKNHCFIKNIDWRNNPFGFVYKKDREGEIHQADITAVREFGINGEYKYLRATVKID
ncbi:hypothetical protein [Sinomicrobium sp.]